MLVKNRFSLIGNVSTLVFTCWVKKKADRLLDLHDIVCVVDYRLFNYFILSFLPFIIAEASQSNIIFNGKLDKTSLG